MTPTTRSNFRRWAAGLFEQQLWCWGRDVVRPEGNLLLEVGMCRYRTTKAAGATLYKVSLEEAEVWLWAFGLLFRKPETGCIFLGRYGFDPQLVQRPPEHPVHQATRIGPLVRPVSAGQTEAVGELVREVAAWIARYEHWVAEAHGIAYRNEVLAARDRSPAIPAAEMAESWERLAKKSFRLADQDEDAGPWGKLMTALRFASQNSAPPLTRGPASPTYSRNPFSTHRR